MASRIASFIIVALLVVSGIGCQQGTQPAANPLTGVFAPPVVAPPSTGSYNIPDKYYKGQASARSADDQGSRFATSFDGDGSRRLAASFDGSVGSGVVTSPADFGTNDFDQRGSVQPANFEATTSVPPQQLQSYRGPAPTIPRAALRSNLSSDFENRDAQPEQNALQRQAQANPLNWRQPGTSPY